MLKFVFSTTLAFVSFVACGQFTLTGFVRNPETGRPVEGVSIMVSQEHAKSFHPIGLFATSDEFGKFAFKNLEKDKYFIFFQLIGYAPKMDSVTIESDVALSFDLEQTAIVTEEVVVNATRANEKTPATYSTLSKDKIQKQNFGQDLPFLLNWTPSVVTTSDAGTGIGYTGIRIRGSDPTRINVTINGIPYNDSESLGTFWVDVPDIASSSQSIQIQRGVGTSTNGAGAFGATINLQTNTRNEKPYVEFINTAGFYKNSTEKFFEGVKSLRHTVSAGSGLLKGHWILDGRFSKISSDGYIDRATADLTSYYFSGACYSEKTVVKALAFGGKERTYQSWYGVPESRLNGDQDAMLITAVNEGWNQFQTNNLLKSNSRTFNPYTYKDQVDDYSQNHFQLHFTQRLAESMTLTVSPHYTRGRGYYEEFKFDDDFSHYNISPVVVNGSPVESSDLVRRR